MHVCGRAQFMVAAALCTSRKLLRLAEVCSASVLPSPCAVWMSCLMRGGFHPLKVSGARRNSAQRLRDSLSKCSAVLMPDMVRFSSFENLLCQVDFFAQRLGGPHLCTSRSSRRWNTAQSLRNPLAASGDAWRYPVPGGVGLGTTAGTQRMDTLGFEPRACRK